MGVQAMRAMHWSQSLYEENDTRYQKELMHTSQALPTSKKTSCQAISLSLFAMQLIYFLYLHEQINYYIIWGGQGNLN